MRETYLPIYRQVLSLGRTDEPAAAALAAQTAEEARDAGDAAVATFFDALSLRVRGQHDEAIPLFEQCRDAADFPLPGELFFELGRAHGNLGDYDKAIECYHNALDEESYDTPGSAWNNMAIAYGHLGEHGKAIECYEKALAEESYKTPGNVWNNMGVAYQHLGDHDKAIECYTKAVDSAGRAHLGHAWHNMGLLYWIAGRLDPARTAFENAIHEYERQGDTGDAENARERLAALERPDEDSANQLALPSQEARAGEPFAGWATGGPESDLDDVFVFLKDWSGSSPYAAVTKPEEFGGQPIVGGGYFLKWNGRGTVIDPGIGFVTNFLGEPFHSCEVHHVLTTHAHIDHTADLMALQNLHKEYCEALDKHGPTGGTARSSHPLTHFWDRTTFRINPYIPTCDAEDGAHELTPSSQPHLPSEAAMTITPLHSQHCDDSVALLLMMKVGEEERVRIGLTSDAAVEAAGSLAKAFQGCDVIILHFSKRHTPDPLTGQVKESHLGFEGCIEIIKDTDAQVYVVAEFCAEDGEDHRIRDTRTIGDLAETQATVVPADIGLTLWLPREQGDPVRVRCSRCKQPCEANRIIVQTPQAFQRITYVCPDCTL